MSSTLLHLRHIPCCPTSRIRILQACSWIQNCFHFVSIKNDREVVEIGMLYIWLLAHSDRIIKSGVIECVTRIRNWQRLSPVATLLSLFIVWIARSESTSVKRRSRNTTKLTTYYLYTDDTQFCVAPVNMDPIYMPGNSDTSCHG